jgi:NitT/TauT family transport system ATP-binding protein
LRASGSRNARAGETPPARVSQPGEPAPGAASIEVSGVYKVFAAAGDGGGVVALQDVSATIHDGELVTFVGPSGCGKSTLLNIVAGLLEPSQGVVRVNGHDVTAPTREIGMMFQVPVLFPWRTVLENVLLPIEVFGWKQRDHRERAESLLAMVGLEGFEGSYPWQLSGGMQQRVALARVLLYDPALLLLDEPFGALDEFTREAMNLELLRIWSETRKTIVLVTHNINEAVFMSDRVVVMTPRPGKVAKVVDVELPRPRTRAVMRTQEYADKVFEIRELLGVS